MKRHDHPYEFDQLNSKAKEKIRYLAKCMHEP